MNDKSLSGAMLLLVILEDSLNLEVINVLPANNVKVYKITSSDGTLEINLKGNELVHLGDFAEDIITYICDEYGLPDIDFDRNNENSMLESLTTLYNHYVDQSNDKIRELYPEDEFLEPHKIAMSEELVGMLNNLRANSNEHDGEDDVLTTTTDLLVLTCFTPQHVYSEEIKSITDVNEDIFIEEFNKRKNNPNLKNWLNKKETLDEESLKNVDLERVKLLLYSRVFRNLQLGLTHTIAFNNILQLALSGDKDLHENIFFHDKKSAPIETEMLKIKMFNTLTDKEYAFTSDQEKDVMELFKNELDFYREPKFRENHLDNLIALVKLSANTNYGRERQLLETYIVTLMSLNIPLLPPLKNIPNGISKNYLTVEGLEDIIRNNYDCILKDRNLYSFCLKNLKLARDNIKAINEHRANPNAPHPRIISMGSFKLDELPEFFKNMLSSLDGLDNAIGLNSHLDEKIDSTLDLIAQTQDLINERQSQDNNNPYPKESDEEELLTDDERKVLEEYLPKEFYEDEDDFTPNE